MKYKSDEINELLVDYLEGDVSEDLKSDLKLVVENSPLRSKALRALTETRKIVKVSDSKPPELSEAFFNNLHSKIMADVAQQKPQPRVRLWLEEQSWRSYATAAVFVLVTSSVLFSFFRPAIDIQTAHQPSGDMLLSISVEVPEAFATSLINDRDSSDFFMDAMAEKVAQAQTKNANDIFAELGQ